VQSRIIRSGDKPSYVAAFSVFGTAVREAGKERTGAKGQKRRNIIIAGTKISCFNLAGLPWCNVQACGVGTVPNCAVCDVGL